MGPLGLALVLALLSACRPPEPPVPPPDEDAALSAVASGTRLLEQFRHAEAEERFTAALRHRPDWLPAQVDLAIAQMNQLDPESAVRAEASARQALVLAPDDARALYVLSYVLAERLGRPAEALASLRRACELEPSDAHAWFMLGRAAEEAATDGAATEARDAYLRALEMDPRLVAANYRLGRILLESDDPADQARAETLLGQHERLLAGQPAVQPNYMTRGNLARAYPIPRERLAPAVPGAVALHVSAPLSLPAATDVTPVLGQAVGRFREGITIADLDGDGRLDLLAPMRDPNRVDAAWWRQVAPRSFEVADALGQRGRACSTAAAGDLDRDGDLDLVITCSTGNILVRRDEGAWTSITPVDMASSTFAALRATLVDMDHDGDLDIHAVQPLAFERGKGFVGTSLAWRNDGRAGMTQAAASMGLLGPLASESFLWIDVDDDNGVDCVAVLPTGFAVLHSQRDGPFVTVPIGLDFDASTATPPPPVDLESLDLDGDDRPDIVVMSGGRLTVLMNESAPGSPRFSAQEAGEAPPGATALAVGDLDLDGVRELLVLAAGDPPGSSRPVLLGLEGGPRIPARIVGGDGLEAETLAVADVDGDGNPDLVTRQSTGEPLVLFGGGAPGASGFTLSVAGREGRSNAHGFGAKITVDAGRLHQRFERRAAAGTTSSVVAPEIIGLGGRARADGVTVLWPSGIQQGEIDLSRGESHAIVELDRQPSSCPMLYGWDGSEFRFLTDCFDTAPHGLWVAPSTHWAGDPDEVLRLREGWVTPVNGVLNLSVATFLNETLLADRVSLLALDHDASRSIVVDEGVRLAAPPQPLVAWAVGEARPVLARQEGDVSAALAARDDQVAGYVKALPWMGLAEPHALELELASARGILVLTGSLNFSNSPNLFAAHQAGVSPSPPALQVLDGGRWRDLLPDAGLPAGFHKDVVIDLEALRLPARPVLRLSTNLQVSWDRAAHHPDATPLPASARRELPLLRAEKRWLGMPREVPGPENRWRSFPRDGLAGAPPWIPMTGPATPDGDVREDLAAADGAFAIARAGEEILLAFDDAALGPPAPGQRRTHVLWTHGWVKDALPHTAGSPSVLPLPVAGQVFLP